MPYTYILWSEKTGRQYIGATEDMGRCLAEHNRGQTKSTRSGRPWVLVVAKCYSSAQEAKAVERWLKEQKNRNVLEQWISSNSVKGV